MFVYRLSVNFYFDPVAASLPIYAYVQVFATNHRRQDVMMVISHQDGAAAPREALFQNILIVFHPTANDIHLRLRPSDKQTPLHQAGRSLADLNLANYVSRVI